MKVLIVESNADLGRIWGRFLERQGIESRLATGQAEAIQALRFEEFDALVLQLVLPDGGAIAVSDYATYRNPDLPIITVSNAGFFSDGTVFDLIPNARSMVSTPLRPDDLAAMIEHYARRRATGDQTPALRQA